MIGQAQTGTGKTAAFGLPLLQYLDPDSQETQAIVLTPTRELCIQVTQALRAYAEHLDIEVVAVFGGAPISTQQSRLRRGAHVVVATVGRMMDLLNRRSLVLTSARYVVLDEADEMLDLGLHRGRGEDPADVPLRAPDGAVLGDDPGAGRQARRAVHVRPGDDQGHAATAHGRRDRAGLRRGRRRGARPSAWSRCCGPRSPSRRSSSAAPRSAPRGSTASSPPAGCGSRRCTAT